MFIYKALPSHVGAKVRGTMLPSLSIVFLCTNSHRRFWCDVLMEVVDWSGSASLADQVVTNVACWLGHRDLALEFDADVPAIAGHHLFPARVRNIASQPRRERSHSVWSLADQFNHHVVAAGVGVVGFEEAPVVLPCVLHVAAGRVVQLFGVLGYRGAGKESEKRSLAGRSLQAVQIEVAIGRLVFMVGDLHVEPSKVAWFGSADRWALFD